VKNNVKIKKKIKTNDIIITKKWKKNYLFKNTIGQCGNTVAQLRSAAGKLLQQQWIAAEAG